MAENWEVGSCDQTAASLKTAAAEAIDQELNGDDGESAMELEQQIYQGRTPAVDL